MLPAAFINHTLIPSSTSIGSPRVERPIRIITLRRTHTPKRIPGFPTLDAYFLSSLSCISIEITIQRQPYTSWQMIIQPKNFHSPNSKRSNKQKKKTKKKGNKEKREGSCFAYLTIVFWEKAPKIKSPTYRPG